MLSRELLRTTCLVRHAPAVEARDAPAARHRAAQPARGARAGRPERAAARARSSTAPRSPRRLPAAQSSSATDVFEQLVDPANLARLANEQHRTIVLVLATTGLRVEHRHARPRRAGDRLRRAPLPALPQQQVQPRSDAADRRRSSPSSSAAKRATCASATPDGTDWLLPSPPTGSTAREGRRVSHDARTIRADRQELRPQGRASATRGPAARARVHPHLFRHHLATSMVNDGVSLTGHPEGPRPRLDRDDRPLRPPARRHAAPRCAAGMSA